jgi:hypothetical protein
MRKAVGGDQEHATPKGEEDEATSDIRHRSHLHSIFHTLTSNVVESMIPMLVAILVGQEPIIAFACKVLPVSVLAMCVDLSLEAATS